MTGLVGLSKCEWITYSRLLRVETVSPPGFEPATYRSRSQHANHSATAPGGLRIRCELRKCYGCCGCCCCTRVQTGFGASSSVLDGVCTGGLTDDIISGAGFLTTDRWSRQRRTFQRWPFWSHIVLPAALTTARGSEYLGANLCDTIGSLFLTKSPDLMSGNLARWRRSWSSDIRLWAILRSVEPTLPPAADAPGSGRCYIRRQTGPAHARLAGRLEHHIDEQAPSASRCSLLHNQSYRVFSDVFVLAGIVLLSQILWILTHLH